jgi:hypothetical protein
MMPSVRPNAGFSRLVPAGSGVDAHAPIPTAREGQVPLRQTPPVGGSLTTDRTTPLDIALAAAGRGFGVFPFKLAKRRGSTRWEKTPFVKWTEVATTDEAQIRKWAASWPRAQFGWRLPPGTVVVDLDDAEAFDRTERDLAPTARQTTVSGGSHWLYSDPECLARQTTNHDEGFDTRVGGKGWVGLYAIDSFAGDVAPAPEWLLDLGHQVQGGPAGEDAPVTTRHGITVLMGAWRRVGMGEKQILAELRERFEDGRIASSDSSRPWTDADFLTLAAEAAKWKPAPDLPPVLEVRLRSQVAPQELTSAWLIDVDETEPAPLLLGRLDAESSTTLFGDGGVGKGVYAAWMIARLTRLTPAWAVLILDWEHNGRFEWRPRVAGFKGDLTRVRIFQPDKPIWAETKHIEEEIAVIRNRYPDAPIFLVVDSIGYACIGQEIEKSATAINYKSALDKIGLPSLSLAHTTKENADPKYPFGSVYWSNNTRSTIGIAGRGLDPRSVKNRKTNQRSPFPDAEIPWEWSASGVLPETLVERPISFDGLTLMLAAFDGEERLTAKQILAAVLDAGGVMDIRTVQRLLNAKPSAFEHSGPRGKWSWRPVVQPVVRARSRVVRGGSNE